MPKRPSPVRKHPGQRAETLDALTDLLAAASHDTNPPLLRDTVLDLLDVKAKLRVLDARRTAVHDAVKTAYARGARGDGRWYLRETVVAPRVSMTVPAAVIKKFDPRLWEQAKAVRPWTSVTAPDSYTPGLGSLRMPSVPPNYAPLSDLLRAYKHEAFDAITGLKEQERQIKDDIARIADGSGGLWDGLEIRTADGWKIMARRLQYEQTVLKRIAPDTWQRLAERVETPAHTRITVMDMVDAVAKGYCEPGDIESSD